MRLAVRSAAFRRHLRKIGIQDTHTVHRHFHARAVGNNLAFIPFPDWLEIALVPRQTLCRRDSVYGSIQTVVGNIPLILEKGSAFILKKLYLHPTGGYIVTARRSNSDAVVGFRRKLERKGLSKNAIKSQLRPCLTWNEDIEERLGRKENTRRQVPVRIHDIRKTKTTSTNSNSELKESDTPKSPSKTKVCKLCGKKILGDILDHFSKEHFSFYVANKKTIMSHPGAFAVDEDKYDSKIHLARNIEVIKLHKNHTQNNKQTTETPPKKTHVFNHRKMRGIISDLEEHPQEQTYRGWNLFMCDGCEKTCKHGRVIFVNMKRTQHLCYDCYKHAKSIVKFKRGNKHFYINTPM